MIQTQSNAAHVYTDLNSLQDIRQIGKEDQSAALMQVAKQFESMFLGRMLKSRRDAGSVFSEDSLLSSPESDFYRNMYDDQMSLSLASGQGTGFADVIHRQLMSQYGESLDSPSEIDQSKLYSRRFNGTLREVERLTEQLASELQEAANDPVSREDKGSSVFNSMLGEKGQGFASPADFVAVLFPLAQKVAKDLGVDPKAIVAQAALETGWGKFTIQDEQGAPSHNLFGIKANSAWQGDVVSVQTHEYREGVRVNEQADFRSYASLEEGLADYVQFLKESPRYQNALNGGAEDDEYGYRLQQSGYATDPNYGGKIQRIYHGDTLNDALLRQSLMESNDG